MFADAGEVEGFSVGGESLVFVEAHRGGAGVAPEACGSGVAGGKAGSVEECGADALALKLGGDGHAAQAGVGRAEVIGHGFAVDRGDADEPALDECAEVECLGVVVAGVGHCGDGLMRAEDLLPQGVGLCGRDGLDVSGIDGERVGHGNDKLSDGREKRVALVGNTLGGGLS